VEVYSHALQNQFALDLKTARYLAADFA